MQPPSDVSQKQSTSPVGDATDSPGSSAVADRSRFKCDQCSSTFQRSEHLRRHQRTHWLGNRPFVCSVCGKGFSRSDILNRHALIHSYNYGTIASVGRGGLWMRPSGNRACLECAKARARCSKGKVCSRCASRSLTCVYPTRRKRRKQPDDQQSDDAVEEAAKSNFSIAAGDSVHPATPVTSTQPADDFILSEHMRTRLTIRESPVHQVSRHHQPPPTAHPIASGQSSSYASSSRRRSVANTVTGIPTTSNPSAYPVGVTVAAMMGQAARPQVVTSYVYHQPVTAGPLGGSIQSAPGTYQITYDSQVYDPALHDPLGWLPPDFDPNIDYNSILGLEYTPPAGYQGPRDGHVVVGMPARSNFAYRQPDYDESTESSWGEASGQASGSIETLENSSPVSYRPPNTNFRGANLPR